VDVDQLAWPAARRRVGWSVRLQPPQGLGTDIDEIAYALYAAGWRRRARRVARRYPTPLPWLHGPSAAG